MQFESFSSLSESTSAALNKLWDNIGYTAEERRAELDDLDARVRAVLTSRVTEEKQNKLAIEREIVNAKQAITAIHEQFRHSEDDADETYNTSLPLRMQLQEVNDKLDKLHKAKEERLAVMNDTLTKLHTMCHLMGAPIDPSFAAIGDNISDAEALRLTFAMEAAEQELAERRKSVEGRVQDVSELLEELQMPADQCTELDRDVLSKPWSEWGVSDQVLMDLLARKQELEKLKEERTSQIKALAVEITELWRVLEVEDSEKTAFLGAHSRLGLETLHACREELNKLRLRKQEKLQMMIEEMRTKIVALWEETRVSEADRVAFQAHMSEGFTEACFEVHEKELSRLEDRANHMRPLLKMINRRKEILLTKIDFDQSLKDPNRFKIPGRMLEEEKFRKVLTKELPKLEKSLEKGVQEFELHHGPFMIDGERFSEVLKAEIQAEKINAEEKQAQREQERAAKYGTANTNIHGTSDNAPPTPLKRLPSHKTLPATPRALMSPAASSSSSRVNIVKPIRKALLAPSDCTNLAFTPSSSSSFAKDTSNLPSTPLKASSNPLSKRKAESSIKSATLTSPLRPGFLTAGKKARNDENRF